MTYEYNKGKYGASETLTQLKAYSFNMENGKMVKTKMEGSMVTNEDLSKRKRLTKFTVPQVKVGSVIEYEFSLYSDFFYTISDWHAQSSIPVLYTSYELSIPEYFHFNVNETGYYPIQHAKTSRNTQFSLGGGNTMQCACDVYSFVGRNLPALKSEKYVYNPSVYGQKVSAELMSIQFPGSTFHNYTTTWKDVDERLTDAEGFGDRLGKHVLKEELKAAGVASLPTVEEKVNAVVRMLSAKVRWNDKYSLTGESASTALKEGTGNNATINFMLINMLNDVGVNAYPVVLRTRDYGLLPVTNPTIDALSTVIVGYDDGEKNHYIDASMLQDGYIDILPGKMLVDRAHVVKKDGTGDWVNLQKVAVAKTSQTVTAKLDAQGVLSGTSMARLTALNAVNFRQRFRAASDSATFVSEKANNSGIEISDYKLDHHQGFSPVVNEQFSFTKQCDSAGDMIYLNPIVFPLLSENPFVADERKVPVEFPTCETQVLMVSIALPDGYTVEALPKPVSISTEDKGIRFQLQMVMQNGGIGVRCTYSLGKLLFGVNDYAGLKTIFAEIAKQCADMVVVKKISQQ